MAGLRRTGYSTLVYRCPSGTKSRRLPKVRFSRKTGGAGECQSQPVSSAIETWRISNERVFNRSVNRAPRRGNAT